MAFLEGLSYNQIVGTLPERKVLANGLEVLFYRRPGVGLCTVQAWVRTGSMHEGAWEGSGISHYLEHMVFKGTNRFSNREITDAVHRSGGNSNAYTSFDRTVYYIDAPQEGLETSLEVISEMIFAPRLDDADAKMEREVILREIAMRDDEHDSVLAESFLMEAIRHHPMRHPVIGHRDLFIRIKPEDLRQYHAGRYVPENVVLAVGGSLESEAVFDLVEKWFGRFSRQPLLQIVPPFEPHHGSGRRVDLIRDVSTTKGIVSWRAPGSADEDAHAFNLFLGVLGSGASSVLWQELREKQKLVHGIDASALQVRDLGLAWMGWTGEAGTSIEKVEQEILKQVAELSARGVTPEEFQKVRRQTVVGMINGMKKLHGATARYASAAAMGYDLGWIKRNVERLAKLKPEDLSEAARRWLKPDAISFASLTGKSQRPKAVVSTAAPATTENFEVITLDNGVRVVLQPDSAIPKAGFGVYFGAGVAYEAKELRGITGLMASLLTCDTVKNSKEAIAVQTDAMGATFAEHASQLSAGLWGEALSSDFEAIAHLVADGVLCPKFTLENFAQEQAAAISACREAEDEIVEKTRLHLMKQFFGEHPLGVSLAGTPETLQKIQPGDLAELHRRLVVAGNIVIGISGDFNRQAALELVKQRFGTLPKVNFTTQTLALHAPRKATHRKESAVGEQAVVALAFPHCGFASDQNSAGNITQELLSGMASGLFRRVREEKGLAYFVGASQLQVVDQGTFYLVAGTAPQHAATVLEEMRAELVRLRTGKFTAEEVDDVKRSIRVARRQARQAVGARVQGAIVRELVGLGANFDAQWEKEMNETDTRKVQAFVKKYLDPQLAQELVMLPQAKA